MFAHPVRNGGRLMELSRDFLRHRTPKLPSEERLAGTRTVYFRSLLTIGGELDVRVNDSPGSSHTVTFDPAKIPARPSFVMSATVPPRMYIASRTKSLFVYVQGVGPMATRATPSGLKPLFSHSREVPANRFAFPIAPIEFPLRSFIATRTFVAPATIPRPWACVLAA